MCMKFDFEVYKNILAAGQEIYRLSNSLNSEEMNVLEQRAKNIQDINKFGSRIVEQLQQTGVCLLSNAPIDNLTAYNAPLPEDITTPAKIAILTLTWVLHAAMGLSICGIEGVKKGAFFHNIVPTSNLTGFSAVNDAAWDRSLGFHQEMAFMNRAGLKTVPSCLALLCLRGGEGEKPLTYAVSTSQLLKVMSAEAIKILHLPLFIVRAPESFTWVESPQALLYPSHEGDKRQLTYSSLYTGTKKTVEVSKAACERYQLDWQTVEIHLQALETAYQEVEPLAISFTAGDLLILDNRVVQHARSLFTPNITDRRKVRWLLRAYGVTNDNLPSGRIFCTASRLAEVLAITKTN